MTYLVLVRHGESEWNALGRWTGKVDVDLTDRGRKQARTAATTLENIELHVAHTSSLKRAKQTWQEIKDHLGAHHVREHEHPALDERDYGELTGKNKWEVRDLHGEEQFTSWRRGWDHPVPGGETLKDVYARVIPYFEEHILPDLKRGQNVIVAAHGNTLRALIKHLEDISHEDVSQVELETGEAYLYQIDDDGNIHAKEIRKSAEVL